MRMANKLAAAAVMALGAQVASADNWTINMTVDNQFDVYFGTPMTTNFFAGGGNSWPTTYTFTATGRLPTDYLYVSTASDHSVAQGFIGEFTNTTTSQTIVTGTTIWEVFPAGAHPATNPYWPNPWPASLMPTQSQVDTAIAYATTNGLWQAPATAAGYTNGASPWGFRAGIPANANWIWHDSGNVPGGAYPSPFNGGNHDEFLVFRVAGAVPTPGAACTLGLAGLMASRRRRA